MSQSIFKLGLAGTHSTGKSTVIDGIKTRLEAKNLKCAVVENVASEALALGFPILRDHTFKSTLWIISRVISKELESELSADVVLVDRPVADALGYLWAALEYHGAKLLDAEDSYLRQLVTIHSATYNLSLRTQVNAAMPLGAGKVRDAALVSRAAAARHIDRAFSELSIPSQVVSSESHDRVMGNVVETVLQTLARKSAASRGARS